MPLPSLNCFVQVAKKKNQPFSSYIYFIKNNAAFALLGINFKSKQLGRTGLLISISGLIDTRSLPECRFVEGKDVKCRVWGVKKVMAEWTGRNKMLQSRETGMWVKCDWRLPYIQSICFEEAGLKGTKHKSDTDSQSFAAFYTFGVQNHCRW